MQIHFERTGGFAGLRLTTTLNSATLSPEDAHKLQELIDQAEFFALPPVLTAKTPGADRFQYKLTVETQGRQHTVEVDEGAAPATLRPLLNWLTTAAKTRKP
jgi:hypothetical protein